MKFPSLSDGSPVALGKRKRQSTSPGLASSVPDNHAWQNTDLSRLANLDPDVGKRPRLSGPDFSQDVTSGQRSTALLSDLPPEIWQHIFCHVDPVALGRLMRVNRLFRSLLDPAVPLPEPSGVDKAIGLRLRKQDLVWAISRKTFLSGFPRPLEGMTELAMWRLVRGTTCYFCNASSLRPPPSASHSPWNAGPGKDSVRTIWPFRVRACTSCLKPRLIKDTTLLMSSSAASTLRSGLPFAIFTSDWDYVLGTSLQNADPPSNLQLIKYFFLHQVDELQNQLQYVQTLGSAASEEWFKGLEDRGSHLNSDAARFEQCELQGTFTRLPQSKTRINLPSRTGFDAAQDQLSETVPTQKQIPVASSGHTDTRPLVTATTPDRMDVTSLESVMNPSLQPHPTIPQHPNSAADLSSLPVPRNRHGRSLQEAEQAKAERRTEIERRCQAMIPPILQSTLPFMDAFQAAIKIARPLTEDDWKILEPRLLSQRIAAQHKEAMQVTPSGSADAQLRQQQLEEEQRVAQENETNMWSELNVSSRDKITRYAQKFIQQTWSGGKGVTKATSSTFAAEVLCHVRQRFDDEIAEEDKMLAMKGTAFPHTPESLANRRLTLEDMKWTFEEFVKPHTDKYGKDVFLCRDCDDSQKLFPFEGIIQHYAAKHTNNFSRGKAVVYWKADWPSEPPFDPSPNIPWVQNPSDSLMHPRANMIPTTRARTAPKSSAPRSISSQETISNELVWMIQDVWHLTEGVWNLPHSLRLYVVIQITGKRFSQRFNEDLGFHSFFHCVQSRPELYLIHTLSGLHCKLCVPQPDLPMSQIPPSQNFGLSLTDLLMHFQKTHIDMDASSSGNGYGLVSPPWTMSSASGRLDWKRDMVLLPHGNEIQDILRSPSTDPMKLQLISEALSSPAYASTIVAGPRSVLSSSEKRTLPPRHANYEEHPRAVPSRAPLAFLPHEPTGAPSALSAPSLHPSEDEYDPHRPATQPRLYKRRPPSGSGRVYQIAGHGAVETSSLIEKIGTSPRGWLSTHDNPYYRDEKGPTSNDGFVTDFRRWRTPPAAHGRPRSRPFDGESQLMHGSTERAAASVPRGSPRVSGAGAGISTAAVEFLNNFDKMPVRGSEELVRSINGPTVRYLEGDDRRPEARIMGAAHETNSVAQEGNIAHEGYVYARSLTPSLPIRPREVYRRLPSNHGRLEGPLQPGMSHEDSAFDRQGTALTGSYGSDLPERIHRIERQERRIYPIAGRYFELVEEETHPEGERQEMRESRFAAVDTNPRAWYDDQGQAIASGRELAVGPEYGSRSSGHERYEPNQDHVRYVTQNGRPVVGGIYHGDAVYSPAHQEPRITFPEYEEIQYLRSSSFETSQPVRVHNGNYAGHEETFMVNEQRHPASQG
ncbi:hypothetical protein, variant [Exophiala mesophila]|uniref:F-box domain-containing protein n=1 Tax=Exophiala mesophila TaxID=212818 RepID=A0A0D1Z510_EXOME|nr:hypothetical protein, variant [Exophiala mesophila]KIV89892.1 hypothetical protein, variant [Exophiala mesophila]